MDRNKLIAMLAGEPTAAFGTGSPSEEAQKPSGLAALFGGAYNALGDLSKRAFGASETMRSEGTYNPAPMVEAAMLPMGTGAIAGAPVRAGEAVLGAGPIRAYHGSPHDFDRFDLSKIGTGEGAQAYGHGLYFAENEGVARAYKKNLAPASADIAPSFKGDGWQVTTRDGGNFGREFFATKEEAEAFASKFDNGKMYEVNINADPAHFLNWDKPLSQQPQAFKGALPDWIKQYGGDLQKVQSVSGAMREIPGDSLYQALSKALAGNEKFSRDPRAAANVLQEAGIPGIKYLDQGSRGAGQGSSNYVVFDDKLIDIMRKYGLAALPASGVAYGAAQDQPRGLAAINTNL